MICFGRVLDPVSVGMLARVPQNRSESSHTIREALWSQRSILACFLWSAGRQGTNHLRTPCNRGPMRAFI